MATDALVLETIKETQQKLGKFVKKPPLTEKLLKKPPFRFLHDVITGVNKNTGFFDGLFSPEELLSENVNDRESKIYFLSKIIDVINIVTDSSLTVKPTKIIAGHEPEKTNELLQKIGYALENKLDSKMAINTVNDKFNEKRNKNPTKPIKQASTEKVKQDIDMKSDKEKSTIKITKSSEKLKESSRNRSTSKSNKKDNSPVKPQSRQSETRVDKRLNKSEKPDKISNTIKNDNKEAKPKQKKEKNEPVFLQDGKAEIIKQEENELSLIPQEKNSFPRKDSISSLKNENDSGSPNHTQKISLENNDTGTNISDVKNMDDNIIIEKNIDDITQQAEIPQKVIDYKISSEDLNVKLDISDQNSKTVGNSNIDISNSNNVDVGNVRNHLSHKHENGKEKTKKHRTEAKIKESKVDQKIDNKEPSKTTLQPPPIRTSSARPGAPRLRERNPDVIVQASEPVLLGKVNVIVENFSIDEDEDGSLVTVDTVDNSSTNIANQKIEYETSGNHSHLVQQILETQKELGSSTNMDIGWEYSSRKDREAQQAEVETIKVGLQALSRSANPLGKLLDHIQEDVEVMRQEWIQWTEDYKKMSQELEHQRSLTDDVIKPLENKLDHLNLEIKEKLEHISSMKSDIHKNTEKINELLSTD